MKTPTSITGNIEVLEQKLSEVKRTIKRLQSYVMDHSEKLSEIADPNEHKWSAFDDTLDTFKEAISDLEVYGFDDIRKIKNQ